jgi:hypothetical protein
MPSDVPRHLRVPRMRHSCRARCQLLCKPDSRGSGGVEVNQAGRSNSRWPLGMQRFIVSVLATACVAAAGASHGAGRVFSDDFESGNVNKWTADGTRAMCTVVQRGVDAGTPHGGSHMMQCNWNDTVPWNDPNNYSTVVLPQRAWNYNSEFLIRLWLRYDSDVTHVYGSKVLRLDPNDSLDGLYIIPQMNEPGGPAQIVWEFFNGVQGPVFWGRGTALGDHNWHKLEIYVKASPTANGTARVWIDGSLKLEVTNAVTVAAGHTWGPLYLMSNWSNNPHGANNHVYWDDVEVYTDTGTGASGNMADATITGGTASPNPPQNLTVQ